MKVLIIYNCVCFLNVKRVLRNVGFLKYIFFIIISWLLLENYLLCIVSKLIVRFRYDI